MRLNSVNWKTQNTNCVKDTYTNAQIFMEFVHLLQIKALKQFGF